MGSLVTARLLTHTVAVSEERDGATGTDSARYLAAGAVRSFWVRTRQGDLSEAMPRIRKELERAENAVIESNSILRFLRPDLYLSVLEPGVEDFKESAKRYLDRADAVLVAEGELGRPVWKGVSLRLVEGTPVLAMRPPVYVTDEVVQFVRGRLNAGKRNSEGRLRPGVGRCAVRNMWKRIGVSFLREWL